MIYLLGEHANKDCSYIIWKTEVDFKEASASLSRGTERHRMFVLATGGPGLGRRRGLITIADSGKKRRETGSVRIRAQSVCIYVCVRVCMWTQEIQYLC